MFRWLIAWLAACLTVVSAHAQTTQYSNTTSGAITDNNCGGAGVVTRTFVVATSYTVSDVDIGILLSHTYRSDLRITLTSPGGTTRNVMRNTAGSGDNLNDLFDDEAAAAITSHNGTVTDPLTPVPPPYSHSFRPSATMSSFDGQNAQGTWTLEICDSVAQDVGTFTRADLYISQVPATYADLSLAKTVSNATPASGSAISFTLTVANAATSPQTATGITVQDNLPAGFTYTGSSGIGTYNDVTGVWAVGALAPGATASITINGTVDASPGAIITNTAEISASSVADIDSTVGNGFTTEDDYASRSFTVAGARVAGTPPTLVCPVGTSVHDWDSVTWTAGATSGNFPLTAIGTMNFNISISGGVFLNNATYGGQSPARQNVVTGGFSPAQFSIFELVNMTSQSGSVTSTITLPTAIPGAQFRLFDIDFNAAQFADRVTVTGTFNGSPVTPTLTNGVSNYVVGNSAYGDGTSADASANGNVVVTFASPVDTIAIDYGNHSAAPADPGQQGIAIHDVTFCRPTATLAVAKTSSVVSDPTNGTTDPKAIPGAVVLYCILVSNPGSGTATSVNVGDAVPAQTSFVAGSLKSGTSCVGATTVEDDNGAGADESDPFGASFAGTTVSATAASLLPGTALAVTFNATVN